MADQRCTADRDSNVTMAFASFPHAGPAMPRIAALQNNHADHLSSPNVATTFIDHSSEMWNFRHGGPLFAVLCSMRKVNHEEELMALAAVATLAVSAVAAPRRLKRARPDCCCIAAGVIGSALLAAPSPTARLLRDYGPGITAIWRNRPCRVALRLQRQRFWDGYGWRFAASRSATDAVLQLIPFIFIKPDT